MYLRDREIEMERHMEIDQLSGKHGGQGDTRQCQEAKSESKQDINLRGISREAELSEG